MNSPLVRKTADFLSRETYQSKSPEFQVGSLYRKILNRSPSEAEIKKALDFFMNFKDADNLHLPGSAFAQSILCSNEFLTCDDDESAIDGTFCPKTLLSSRGNGVGFLRFGEYASWQARPSRYPQRAKRVIFLFMKGGPSQVDTFDFKPALQRDHGKPLPFAKPKVQFAKTGNLLASPWSFDRYGESGHAISELFPNLSNHADELCFVHSLHGTNPAHGAATLKLHTGSDNLIRPGMGAWVSYGLGSENENLPAYVTICPTLAHGGAQNWGSAFLPTVHQGCPIGNASDLADKAKIRHISNGRLNFAQQRSQLAMIRSLNDSPHFSGGFLQERIEQRIDTFELAFRMQGSVPEARHFGRDSFDKEIIRAG